ncbi:hypothetical protein GCM10028798_35490 [Humibacter antri]
MTPTSTIENAAHIDLERVRHLSDAELASALGYSPITPIGILRSDVRSSISPGLWNVQARMQRLTEAERRALVADAERLLDEVDVTGSSLGRSARYGWHYLTWMLPLARAWAATGDPRFSRRFCVLFTEWDERRDDVTGEWESLDPIWYSLGIAGRSPIILEALELIGQHLPDPVWSRMVKVLIGGARWSSDEHAAYRTGNWQLACLARLYQVAMALPDAVESCEWRRRALERLAEHLEDDFTEDGGHSERSTGYHAMVLGLLQTCAAIGLSSGDETLTADPRFQSLHAWLGEMTLAQGFTLPFQDTSIDWPGLAMLRGAALCADADLAGLARSWLDDRWELERSLLPEALRARLPEATGSRASERESLHLTGSKYVALRAPGTAGQLALTFNYGPRITHELESHSHFAALDFVLSDRSGVLLWEAGGPQSYDDPRYHDWFQSTRAHNTVVVGEQNIASAHQATLDHLDLGGEVEVIRGHHDGYTIRIGRTISFVRCDPSYMIVDDVLASDADAVLWLHAIDPWIPPTIPSDSPWWATADGRVRLRFLDRVRGITPLHAGTARIVRPNAAEANEEPLDSLKAAFARRLRTIIVPEGAGELPSVVASPVGFNIAWTNRIDTYTDDDANSSTLHLGK